jgi:hypothetical protein
MALAATPFALTGDVVLWFFMIPAYANCYLADAIEKGPVVSRDFALV